MEIIATDLQRNFELLWGGFFLVIGLSLITQRVLWIEFARKLQDRPAYLMLFCLGFFLPALMIVIWHNLWIWDVGVLLTIMGWLMVISYALYAIFPRLALSFFREGFLSQIGRWVLGKGIVLAVLGVLLVFAGLGFF